MLKIKQIYPKPEGILGNTRIDKPLNDFINLLNFKGKEIRNITYISDRDGILTTAIVEYSED